MYDKLDPETKAKYKAQQNAYRYGVQDAVNGRERKNGSDCYREFADQYYAGYHYGTQHKETLDKEKFKEKKENLDHLSEFFKFWRSFT